MKHASLRRLLPAIAGSILLTFLYLTLPLQSQSPTGLQTFSPAALVDGCAVINDSTSLISNVISNTTCFTINASDMFLNCSGFTIFYGMDGTQNSSFGIQVNNQTNVTIQGCTIRDINASGGLGMGINFTNVNNSRILNNSIFTNGTSLNRGIRLSNESSRNIIANNTIATQGTSTSNDGITIFQSTSNNITGNTISANGTSSNHGINIVSNVENSTVANNHVSTRGTSSNDPIIIGASSHNNITNNTLIANGSRLNVGIAFSLASADKGINHTFLAHNTITVEGNDTTNAGILLSTGGDGKLSANNTFLGNNIRVIHGTTNYGILIRALTNLTFINTNITINSSTGKAITIDTGANGTAFINTILHQPIDWINQSINTDSNFTNTTFVDLNGSIRIIGTFNFSGFSNITKDKLNITALNRAYLNSTNLTYLNQSAEITLFNTNLFDPKPMIDYEDDGIYTDCPLNTCTEVSFNTTGDSAFVFNTTQFTSYSAGDATIFSCNVTINTSSVLTQNLTGNTTCITIGSDNITLDCRGNTIEYGGAGLAHSNAIIANTRNNITVQNCVLRDINSSGTVGVAVNFTGTNDSLIYNNTLQTNGSTSNYGISLINSKNNLIEKNNITTQGTGAGNFGVLISNASNNTVRGNAITTNGTSTNIAVAIQVDAENNTITQNNITGRGTSTFNDGIRLVQRVAGNNITNNRIDAGLLSSNGILLSTIGFGTNYFSFNNITAEGNFSYSVRLVTANSTVFESNTLTHDPYWINSSRVNIHNNFTNTTFATPHGTIQITGTFVVDGSQDIIAERLNITANHAFLNSTNLTFMNQSARVTLFGVSFANPRPEMDLEDDGTFSPCPAGICNEISYSGTTYVFDVTGFSTYQAGETPGGGGSTSGGGGGGVSGKKKTETTPTTQPPAIEQPAPISEPVMETPAQEAQEQIIEQETAPETPEPESILPQAVAQAKKQAINKLSAFFYTIAAIALAIFLILAYVHNRRTP